MTSRQYSCRAPDLTTVYKRILGQELLINCFFPFAHVTARPVVILLHGGGWTRETPERLFPHAAYFAERGAVAVCPQYRLIREESGDITDCLQDCFSALAFVCGNSEKWKLDLQKITAFGDSAGGYLACCLGNGKIASQFTENLTLPACVVALNPITDLTGEWLFALGLQKKEKQTVSQWTMRYELAKALSPLYTISQGDSENLLYHGLSDTVVLPQMSKSYADRLTECGVQNELHLLTGLSHGFILYDYIHENQIVSEVLQKIGAALFQRRLLCTIV